MRMESRFPLLTLRRVHHLHHLDHARRHLQIPRLEVTRVLARLAQGHLSHLVEVDNHH